MGKPRLLDLFSGAGGAARGYQLAGFHVTGVDIVEQPNYCGDWFEQCDTLALAIDPYALRRDYDAVHASPPCQAWTAYKRTGGVGEYPELIDPVRALLERTGLPYAIENVAGAPLRDPVMLCDSMFDPPQDLERHRYFETNWPLQPPDWPCRHKLNGPDRFPGGRSVQRGGVSTYPVRRTIEVGAWDISFERQKEAMGVDWDCTLEELSEMVPPRYTRFIGEQLLVSLDTEDS